MDKICRGSVVGEGAGASNGPNASAAGVSSPLSFAGTIQSPRMRGNSGTWSPPMASPRMSPRSLLSGGAGSKSMRSLGTRSPPPPKPLSSVFHTETGSHFGNTTPRRAPVRVRSEYSLPGSGSPVGTLPTRDTKPGTSAGRTASPTFNTSEDWMMNSSPRSSRREIGTEGGATPRGPPMPSSNFHSRVRRMHSGRQTENSPSNDELLHFKGSEPAKSVITNSLDHKASRGKKTGIGRDETQAKRRLMLDDTQVVPQPTQRQHKFTTDGNVREPEAGGVSRKATWSEPSAEEASVPVDRKYMVGNAIVTWASGRKVMPKSFSHQCTEAVVAHVGHTPRAGGSPSPPASKQQPQTFGDFSPRVFSSDGVRSSWSPREPCPQHMDKASFHQNMEASVAAHLRDHRNSDVVRQALQPTAVAMGAPRPRPHTAGVSAAPAAGAPVVIETQCADTQVHSYGKLSSMPSSMTKDTAYMHSGLQVVKFGTRMPGLYSPNSPRISASQAVC